MNSEEARGREFKNWSLTATNKEELSPMSASLAVEWPENVSDAKAYINAPYSYKMQDQDSAQLNNGSLQYTVTDFVIPGKNGFDLVMQRNYHSGMSNTKEMTPKYEKGIKKAYWYGIQCDKLIVNDSRNGFPVEFDRWMHYLYPQGTTERIKYPENAENATEWVGTTAECASVWKLQWIVDDTDLYWQQADL